MTSMTKEELWFDDDEENEENEERELRQDVQREATNT